MSSFWYLVAIMFGIQSDGKLDVFLFEEPRNNPGFESKEICRFFVSGNLYFIMEKLQENYGDRPVRQLLCVPHEDVKKFLEANGLS